jgi:hypothetical protein
MRQNQRDLKDARQDDRTFGAEGRSTRYCFCFCYCSSIVLSPDRKITKNRSLQDVRYTSIFPSFDSSITQINNQAVSSIYRLQIRVLLSRSYHNSLIPSIVLPTNLLAFEILYHLIFSHTVLALCYIYDENTSQYEVVIGAEMPPMRSCYTAYFVCRYPSQGGTFLLLASCFLLLDS